MTTSREKKSASKDEALVQADLAPGSRATLEAAPDGYAEWIREVKVRVHAARQRAARAVNSELIGLYWRMGREVRARQQTLGWGAKIVDRISADLRTEFPDTEDFSPRNLKYMCAFAVAWPDEDFVQGVLAQLPWYTHLALLEKLETAEERRWYAQKAIEHGWSRNVLVLQIEAKAMKRTGAALTNFGARLPEPHSDLARESLKDPYRLDFLGLGEVVELKAGRFKPEHLAQLGFYCTAIDAQVKAPDDAATIGLLLCKARNALVAEYALRTTAVPLGIADDQLVESLPKELDANLPSIARIEEELARESKPKASARAESRGRARLSRGRR